jgi:hypothetical protein
MSPAPLPARVPGPGPVRRRSLGPFAATLAAGLLAAAAGGWAVTSISAQAQQQPETHRLFSPKDLGMLEVPDREEWQQIESIKRRVQFEGLTNVQTVLGAPDQPNLPRGLDAVLIVDTYPQFRDPVKLLRQVREALAPAGRVGIVDFKKEGAGGPGPDIRERLDPESIKRDAAAAGLRLRRHETFLRYQYLLVFER